MPDPRFVSPGFEWYGAVGAVVAGHVISIWVAHRLMLGLVDRPRQAALASLPLTVLMVGYTAVSLWIIAEPLVRLPDADTLKPHTVIGEAGAGRARVHAGLEPAEAVVRPTHAGMDDARIVEGHEHPER
jgi:hypothetical protein